MHISTIDKCRICGNPHLEEVIDLGEMFSQGAFIDKEKKLRVPYRKFPNRIVRCNTMKQKDSCGLIQSYRTIPTQILYSNYWYQTSISNTMKTHLSNVVKEILQLFEDKITGKEFPLLKVLDIGCNDGYTLLQYPELFDKFGCDPSNIAAKAKEKYKDLIIYNTTFPCEELNKNKRQLDIITAFACMYDLDDPISFIKSIKELLSEYGIFVFEVADWRKMVETADYSQLVAEHIEEYHLASIEYLLEHNGLKLFNARQTDTNNGSLLCFATHKNNKIYDTIERQSQLEQLRFNEFESSIDDDRTYIKFRERIESHKEQLYNLIKKLKSEGKIIHIYGASTKLNTILGYCGIDSSLIKYAAERSPEKYGGKTLSGIKMISEEESRAMKPDYYLVGPYHFKNEILERESEIRKTGTKFIFPLPEIEII